MFKFRELRLVEAKTIVFTACQCIEYVVGEINDLSTPSKLAPSMPFALADLKKTFPNVAQGKDEWTLTVIENIFKGIKILKYVEVINGLSDTEWQDFCAWRAGAASGFLAGMVGGGKECR